MFTCYTENNQKKKQHRQKHLSFFENVQNDSNQKARLFTTPEEIENFDISEEKTKADGKFHSIRIWRSQKHKTKKGKNEKEIGSKIHYINPIP